MELGNALFSIDYLNLNESEQFSNELERAIREWHLSLDQLDDLVINQKDRNSINAIKLVKCFNLNFKIQLFEIGENSLKNNYKHLLDNLMNQVKGVNYCNDNEVNFIQRVHGLNNFILVQPANKNDILESERIIRILNSAINCSIASTKCIYPIFIQIKDLIFELSVGNYINFGIKIQYDSALFELNQFNSSTIAEFLKIFENKLKRNLQLDDNVRCFLANRRCLNNYSLAKIEFSEQLDELFKFPDDLKEQFKELRLLNQLENQRFQIKHTEILPKIQGTQWTFNADESILKDFTKLENGSLNIQINSIDESTIFKSVFYCNKLLHKISKDYLKLRRDQLVNLNEFNLFCNENNELKQNYLNYFMVKSDLNDQFIDDNLIQFKSTPFDSIIFRFASYLFAIYTRKLKSNENEIYFEINDCWGAIVDQLRRYWELCELIPCVEDRLPNLNSNLLTQKIQMLNCCIKEKRRRESTILNQMKNESKDEDDEFFDCQTGKTQFNSN